MRLYIVATVTRNDGGIALLHCRDNYGCGLPTERAACATGTPSDIAYCKTTNIDKATNIRQAKTARTV